MSMQIRADQERRTAARHGRRLQYLTIAWNLAECLISIGVGIVAGSIALVGFGFDSAIEVASSLAALWRLARDKDETARERAERRTLRIIGLISVDAPALEDNVVVGRFSRLAPGHALPSLP